MRVLGVDPGSNATGFGLIVREGSRAAHVSHGVLRPPAGAELSVRLSFLQTRLSEIIREHEPDVAIIERVFIAANPRSALVLGQARGALLAALGSAGIQVAEISAREAKKAMTGSGAADKKQMQLMVSRLLKLERAPATDAADALAMALSYSHVPGLTDVPTTGRRRSHRKAMTDAYGGRSS